jgi:hypothetical protein
VRWAWHAWKVVWKEDNTAFVYDSHLTRAEVHRERANRMRVLSNAFVSRHVAAVGVTQGLYLHIASCTLTCLMKLRSGATFVSGSRRS